MIAFSVAHRLGGISQEEVIDLVKGRRELFRFGLTGTQGERWKDKYLPPDERSYRPPAGRSRARPARKLRSEWLEAEPKHLRKWLRDDTISSSEQALKKFLSKGFSIDDIAFRSQFRITPDLDAKPSDLPIVNWGLEHIERLRKGRAENWQIKVALAGVVGVVIGALIGLMPPIVTSYLQGRPADTARLQIDHQTRLDGYGALAKAAAGARLAAEASDRKALSGALGEVSGAATTLSLLGLDIRGSLGEQPARVVDACAPAGAQGSASARETCLEAIQDLQHLIDGPLADVPTR